uniref:Ubiquitin-like protein 3 n=1 Tax=Nothobranchius furzeri TaxID=105023 RepID=A0A8C6M7G2_NOTFU
MPGSIPVDMINLRIILISGKTKEFLFSPDDSAADIAKHVYDNWPMDWEEEQASSPNILRLIYQGRFLHGNVTLGALKLPLGKTAVMHLVSRENLPEPNSQGNPLCVSPFSLSDVFFTSWKKNSVNVLLPAGIYCYTWRLFEEQLLVQIIGSFSVFFPDTAHCAEYIACINH